MVKWTVQEELLARDVRLSGQEVAARLGRTLWAVEKWRQQHGVNLDNAPWVDFFAEPGSVNSYWAGFLAADGCITDIGSTIMT